MENNPIIMYLIVRESLGMSIGKTAAQVAHAAQKLQQKYQKHIDEFSEEENLNILDKVDIFDEWCNDDYRKVVLKADEKEWIKLKSELDKDDYYLIVDKGLTELESNSETVIGVWPMYKNEAPKIIKKLQTL